MPQKPTSYGLKTFKAQLISTLVLPISSNCFEVQSPVCSVKGVIIGGEEEAQREGIMKFFGCYGTRSGLGFRLSRLVLTGTSFYLLTIASRFTNLKGFGFVMFIMLAEAMWTLMLSCMDIVLLCKCVGLRHVVLASLAAADSIVGLLLLGATCFAAGPTLYFYRDTGFCSNFMPRECNFTLLSFGSALLAWGCIICPFLFAAFAGRNRG